VGERGCDIAILTSGRFHVLDLARELEGLGHRVRFYSLLPPWRLSARGLPARRGVWLGVGAAPLFFAQRFVDGPLRERLGDLTREAIDRTAALLLRRCDVFIGMSGMSLHTAKTARSRFGALTILERSSMHIDLQLATLGAPTGTPIARRERLEYDAVDVISIPSMLVENSFRAKGFPPSRLARNPLGVDLTEFPYESGPSPNGAPLRAVFAGTFSRQKGADLMVSALATLPEVALTHVGATGDVPPATLLNLNHRAPVPQAELSGFYRDADVLLLPSRQDGFGMVMSQALASGCHVIASDHTGAPDLAVLTGGDRVTLVPAGDSDALASALRTASDRRDQLRADRRTAPTWRDDLSWRAYAERYDAMIRAHLRAR